MVILKYLHRLRLRDKLMQNNNIHNIIFNAGHVIGGEKVLILFDHETKAIAELFFKQLEEITLVQMCEVPNIAAHGCEPSENTARQMYLSDVVFCLTSMSLAHTQARIAANNNGVRFLSLPGYEMNMLADSSLSIDFKSYYPEVKQLSDFFTKGECIRVVSESGTDIVLDVSGRKGNCCPGFVDSDSLLGSPPDIEANIAPNELFSKGLLVVDGSITCPEIGLVTENVELRIEDGLIVGIESDKYSQVLWNIFDEQRKCVLAELGVGFNHQAKLCGNMLIDEGARGCIHCGFGSNATIGGNNAVGFHLDFVIKQPSLYIDDALAIRKGVVL